MFDRIAGVGLLVLLMCAVVATGALLVIAIKIGVCT
jgi:hypothetical protein